MIPQQVIVTSEEHDYRGTTASWLAQDAVDGSRLSRSCPALPIRTCQVTTFDPVPFAHGDYWILAEHGDEVNDGSFACDARIDNFANGESTDGADVVLWYRLGDLHEAHDECQCGRVGPRLEPVGDWTPAN